jgi:dTDP-4-dehydrorhamnose 3,5-epimerase
MEFISLPIQGLILIKPKIFSDSRGYFFESFNKSLFHENGITLDFVQDNQSLSQKGTVRGLHFQNAPFAQAKLVRVIKGKVLDVAVDIRKNSTTYGKHYSCELSEENQHQLFIPIGFAHGFATLEDNTIFSYKCSNFYNKQSEDTILWNDKDLNIDWRINHPILSEKDKAGKLFKDFASLF